MVIRYVKGKKKNNRTWRGERKKNVFFFIVVFLFFCFSPASNLYEKRRRGDPNGPAKPRKRVLNGQNCFLQSRPIAAITPTTRKKGESRKKEVADLLLTVSKLHGKSKHFTFKAPIFYRCVTINPLLLLLLCLPTSSLHTSPSPPRPLLSPSDSSTSLQGISRTTTEAMRRRTMTVVVVLLILLCGENVRADYSVQLATTALYFAKAAYCEADAISSWTCASCAMNPGMEEVRVFTNIVHSTQAFVGVNKSTIVVSFRGT
ncbi:lipase, putative, partial [Trypanosoma cruzi marinkellei]